MRLFIKIILIVGIVVFVALQFFQPEKNLGEITSTHILKSEQIPENIQKTLKNACFDCHSNQTNYLWYHKIAPVSWMVNEHVIDGKDELNFSDWGKMDAYDKIGALEDICQELERGTMPIKSYVVMHKNAKLSDVEVKTLCDWSKDLSEELTEKLNE